MTAGSIWVCDLGSETQDCSLSGQLLLHADAISLLVLGKRGWQPPALCFSWPRL